MQQPDIIPTYQRIIRTSRIIGGSTSISLSEQPDKLLIYDQTSNQSDPVFINPANHQTNLIVNNTTVENMTITNLTTDHIQPQHTQAITFQNSTQTFDIFQQNTDVTTLKQQMASSGDVNSGLQSQLTTIKGQLASTGIPGQGLVASGLQTQLTAHDMTLGQYEYSINDLRTICASLQSQVYQIRMFYPGQIVALMSTQPVIEVQSNQLKLLDGTQTFNKTDNPSLWTLLGYDITIPSGVNGPLPNLQDRYLKGTITPTEHPGMWNIGAINNKLTLTADQLPAHQHYILQSNIGYYQGQQNLQNGSASGTGNPVAITGPQPTPTGQQIDIKPDSFTVNWYICIK